MLAKVLKRLMKRCSEVKLVTCSKEYNDIFGDQNLFKNFGGFDIDKKEEV